MVDAFFLERALRPIALTKKYELPLDHEESRPLDAYVTNTASDQRERKSKGARGSANCPSGFGPQQTDVARAHNARGVDFKERI